MNATEYCAVRALTEALVSPLSAEDQTVQSMPDVSPTKWHRAHTTWFFETFVLARYAPGYRPFDPAYRYLFNSYYEAVGPRHGRPERGLITRPGVAQIAAYRDHVDRELTDLLQCGLPEDVLVLIELGVHHEQQHQELLVMDIKHVLSRNPLRPSYGRLPWSVESAASPSGWVGHEGGIVEIGQDAGGFAFDNEGPRHDVLLRPFELSSTLVTNEDWLSFIEDGGYRRPELWMADGWATVQANGWAAPEYWWNVDGAWHTFGLDGLGPVDAEQAVSHMSWYEADAYARWAGARLPLEAEWEAIAPTPRGSCTASWYGTVWQWTASPYTPYPGFRPAADAVGEYNGKFMVNQQVLRGGCTATPPGHARRTYRNFFPPHARWAFTGLRLARDAR
ncbi:MAG: ergothioneine biosynthesis protein EgtB [Actinomycetota bacterium]|nr:ergothioneine biosynthesis protein EgtB [Actinomycetota bacterium]